MTMKQREDHVQAKYWNGFITRVEAQKVFDEQAQRFMEFGAAIQKLDTVLTYITQKKLGVTIEEINEWVKQQLEEAKKAAQEAANANSQSEQQEPSSLIVAA